MYGPPHWAFLGGMYVAGHLVVRCHRDPLREGPTRMLIGVRSAVGLIACSALAQPAFADLSLDMPECWHGMRPVGNSVLGKLSASGRPSDVHPPRHDIAVILWDEPRTPRPGGNKLERASARTGILFMTVNIVWTAP